MDKHEEKMIAYVAKCSDGDELRQIRKNALKAGATQLARAAALRLYAIVPAEAPGTLEHAVWQSIAALEETLREERGKTVRLSRTRQMIQRKDEQYCVAQLVRGKESEGFRMLQDRDMLDLTFEAVALKFPERFDVETISAARNRLNAAGHRAG